MRLYTGAVEAKLTFVALPDSNQFRARTAILEDNDVWYALCQMRCVKTDEGGRCGQKWICTRSGWIFGDCHLDLVDLRSNLYQTTDRELTLCFSPPVHT